jgi:NADPH:quinone reductase-like Zn-dependent oxidoreductase
MRAAAIDKFGDPEVLKLQTLRVPIPDPSEVLIEVDTAGVGPWDADIRGGWSPGGHIKFPYVLGYEGSGRVVSLGTLRSRQKRSRPYRRSSIYFTPARYRFQVSRRSRGLMMRLS